MRARHPRTRRDAAGGMRPGQGAGRHGQAHSPRARICRALRPGVTRRSERAARMTTTNIRGQVALVTGASRGIGAAIAHELAVRGMKVIGTATTDDGAAKISEALSQYADCKGATLNVNDAKAAETLIDALA